MLTLHDGVRLYYEKLGAASRIILVPNGFYYLRDFQFLADDAMVVFYDVRNRGRSDSVADPSRPARGIEQDVDDLDAVRRHFGADQVDVIGHSYIGFMRLANARLLTVPNAAHAPWIEAPELVCGSIRTFLDGAWPEAAEKLRS